MSSTMENGNSLYARIAELEKENEELKEKNEALKNTKDKLKIDALKDTYYEAGYGYDCEPADYILELLVLVRGEEFCREHFPEFYEKGV